MSDETQATNGEAELLRAYQAAVIEFNLATVPIIVALTAEVRPTTAEIMREEKARVAVVEVRRRVWAKYGQE